jgi:hypothetical protein
MSEICPLCGKPHGKGMPNTDLNPAVAVGADILEPVSGEVPEAVVELGEQIVDGYEPLDETGAVVDAPEFDGIEEIEMPDLSELKLNDLRGIAKELGLKLPFGATKDKIIAIITDATTKG